MVIAAGIGYAVPQLVWIVWFSVNRTQVLRVVRPKWRLRAILDSCINGSSEKVSTLAFSVGIGCSDGVASLSIIWYAQGLFGRLFRGYINGVSPAVSYNFGRDDKQRLSRLFRISDRRSCDSSQLFLGGAVVHLCKGQYSCGKNRPSWFPNRCDQLFDDGDQCVYFRMVHTLSDGRTSFILSFCRTILFMVLPALVIPRSLEMDGVRLSLTVGRHQAFS